MRGVLALLLFPMLTFAGDLKIFEHGLEYEQLQTVCLGLHMGSGRSMDEIKGRAFTYCPVRLEATTREGKKQDLCLVLWRRDKTLFRDQAILKCAQLPASHLTDQGKEELAAFLHENGVPGSPEQADELGWKQAKLPGV